MLHQICNCPSSSTEALIGVCQFSKIMECVGGDVTAHVPSHVTHGITSTGTLATFSNRLGLNSREGVGLDHGDHGGAAKW